MKQKLTRKYRKLQPNEKIQYDDWMNVSNNAPDDYKSNGCIKVYVLAPNYIGKTPREYNGSLGDNHMHFFRFIDCVPAHTENI